MKYQLVYVDRNDAVVYRGDYIVGPPVDKLHFSGIRSPEGRPLLMGTVVDQLVKDQIGMHTIPRGISMIRTWYIMPTKHRP